MQRRGVRTAIAALFLAGLILGTVLILREEGSKQYRKSQGTAFGTTYHITYHSSRPLDKEITGVLLRVDSTFSMFNAASQTARINRGEQPVLNDDFIRVFRLSRRVAEATSGAFDITVAPLVNAWGFGTQEAAVPSDAVVDSLLRHTGIDKVSVSGHRLQKKDNSVQLDFSAVAKGYACDAVAAMLRQHGVEHFMVEIGGEVVCKGKNSEGQAWKIGVTRPDDDPASDTGELEAVLTLTDKAMATSGNYRNFYYQDGRRYAHTIDPHTGSPVQHTLLSATVIAPDCATADAYATAFMVMGLEKARQLLDHRKDLQALLIYNTTDGKLSTWVSPKLQSSLSR